MERVVLAMSGGVDSSVAAHLLQQQGYDVVGVFMRHGEESSSACNLELDESARRLNLPVVTARSDHKQGCCSASDAADARRVAARLNIPFFALDLQADFRRIVDYFVDEYRRGRTPNPCVQCNNWLKFGALFEYADAVDARYVATGHYARLNPLNNGGEMGLYRGLDDRKDQSYVLAGIGREFLPRMLLPVGGFEKPEIRRIAGTLGMNVAEKKDSQEICFVTSGHHGDFVRGRSGGARGAGAIVTSDGRTVGSHGGIENFTVGQRKGLGVAMAEPYFVVSLDADRNEVVIGRREELARRSLRADGCNWLVEGPLPERGISVQIRYNSRPHAAAVERQENATMRIAFERPVESVAPGQLAVVYHGDRVLGGGWIAETE